MLKTFSLYHKIALLLSAVFLVTGMALWFVLWQKETTVTGVENQLDASNRQMQQLQRQNSKKVTTEDEAAMSRSIPKEWEISLFFADLTMAAKDSKVVIRDMSPVKPSDKSQTAATNPISSFLLNKIIPAGEASQQSTDSAQSFGSGQTQQTGTGQILPAGNGQTQPAGNVQTTPPAELKGVTSIDFSIEAEGEANQLLIFLDRLHNMPRLAWVKSFDLKMGNQGTVNGNSPLAKVTVNITVYAQSPWNDKVSDTVQWPFPIQSAGNDKAFGR